ncbi:HlyD family efflux transporter periplasmic adaptor subunit [Lacipirellula sp.]|uniref:HlyD family efflux transporter periplasmic adaptor subunit n=1 Tax=Lacipirellula sp. TaxID=2691419 RepID=UPI003D0EB190
MSPVWSPPAGSAVEDQPNVAEPRAAARCFTKRRLLLLAAIIAVVAAVAFVAMSRWRTAAAPPQAATPVVLNVHSLGYLEPKTEVIRLAAPSTFGEQGRLERLLVAEGDPVAVGSVVAVLDNFNRRSASVAEAEARVAVEVSKLAQIKAGAKPGDLAAQRAMISRAKAVLSQAEVDLHRSERLLSTKAVPQAEVDAANLKVESAREELSHAESTLESLAEVRTVDVDQQERQIAAAKASLAMARAELETTEVRSPIDGQVLKVCIRPGERVNEDGIVELGDTSEMYAVAEVYEADLPRIKLGQPATVRLFTGGAEPLQGEVAEIGMIVAKKDVLANDPVADTDARVVEVRVKLEHEAARTVQRLSNARVEVTIDVAEPSSSQLSNKN